MKKDLVVIGGGPAGLAAAVAAREAGVEDLGLCLRSRFPQDGCRECSAPLWDAPCSPWPAPPPGPQWQTVPPAG